MSRCGPNTTSRGMDCVFAERDYICLPRMVRGYLNQTMEWLPDAVMQRFGLRQYGRVLRERSRAVATGRCRVPPRRSARSEIRMIIPPGATYILVDELQTRLAADATTGLCRFSKNTANTGASPRIRRKPFERSNACASPGVRTSSSRGRPYVAGLLPGNDGIPPHAEPVRVGKRSPEDVRPAGVVRRRPRRTTGSRLLDTSSCGGTRE